MSHDPIRSLYDLAWELGALKRLPRTGWALRRVPDPESVADHCYRTAFLAMVLADLARRDGASVDPEEVLRMALLHEIAEARTGDLPAPAQEYFPPQAKLEAERRAAEALLAPLGPLGERYQALVNAYLDGESLAARLVRAADLAEMLLQAAEYESVGADSLGDFWGNAAPLLNRWEDLPSVAAFLRELYRRRTREE
ncbi:MAG: oxetanocin [Candidatus Poribacteria bacterium]|nr:MAG: oxetanocin [Candidatus Poribacteria bacterium]